MSFIGLDGGERKIVPLGVQCLVQLVGLLRCSAVAKLLLLRFGLLVCNCSNVSPLLSLLIYAIPT